MVTLRLGTVGDISSASAWAKDRQEGERSKAGRRRVVVHSPGAMHESTGSNSWVSSYVVNESGNIAVKI